MSIEDLGVGDPGSTEDNSISDILSGGDSGSGESTGSDQAALLEKIGELQKQVEGLQSLEGKRANEYGHMRKTLENMSATQTPAKADTSGDFANNLINGGEEFLSQKLDEMLSRKNQISAETSNQTRAAILQAVPDFDDIREDMLNAVSKDLGIDKHQVGDQLFADVGLAVNVAKRVKAEKKAEENAKLMEALKTRGVDIEGAKAFARGNSNGESLDVPDDPLASVNPRELSRSPEGRQKLQQLYAKIKG